MFYLIFSENFKCGINLCVSNKTHLFSVAIIYSSVNFRKCDVFLRYSILIALQRLVWRIVRASPPFRDYTFEYAVRHLKEKETLKLMLLQDCKKQNHSHGYTEIKWSLDICWYLDREVNRISVDRLKFRANAVIVMLLIWRTIAPSATYFLTRWNGIFLEKLMSDWSLTASLTQLLFSNASISEDYHWDVTSVCTEHHCFVLRHSTKRFKYSPQIIYFRTKISV